MYLVTVCLHASNWGMSISAMIRQQDVRHQGATFISRITLKKDGDDSSCWYTRAALYSPPVMEWRDHRSPGNYTFPQKHLFLWSCCHEPKAVTLRYEEVFFFFFYPYIQASSTQINYLHVHLIPWTFHHAALSTSLPRPLKCSYIWFQTTELLLLKTLKFIQHNTAPARTELCLSLIDLEKDKRHIISFYVENKSTRNAQYRPTVLNDDFVLVCFNETTFWY